MPHAYVKPFVKRQSEAGKKTIPWTVFPPNDAADVEAISEGSSRARSEKTQGAVMVFRVRELLIRQRAQAINASCRKQAFGMTRTFVRIRTSRAKGSGQRVEADSNRRKRGN
ncbi:hypothetical protein P775_13380 [Puniceibacterium antarcticum]|uniref:Uncharacterized protein n=1 Tax=Puniceibacterium antarcticum TaxID=1206336 RepID=A0A2G8RE35_9RHOB|nr:hypothetical protein P775_13380 [Puniceibacterium antarcticum]